MNQPKRDEPKTLDSLLNEYALEYQSETPYPLHALIIMMYGVARSTIAAITPKKDKPGSSAVGEGWNLAIDDIQHRSHEWMKQ